jgi:phosphinothricin acetyltransferase
MDLSVERMRERDWPAVRTIFQEGIATGNATFETEVPDWETWDTQHLDCCRLVARQQGRITGWAALTPVSSRCIYAGVAEVSIYVRASARGQGVGKALLQALLKASEDAQIWTLQAGIFPENEISIVLHEACGFRTVGRRERLGQLNGTWRDVVLMERRSKVVGT